MRRMAHWSCAAVLGVTFVAVGARPLAAQVAAPPSPPAKSAMSPSKAAAPARAAPHRQPRAADVPNDQSALKESDEDRILNQKLRNICRGC